MYEEINKEAIMRSTLDDKANMIVRWDELKKDGVKDTHLDATLAEYTGRYKASKDILFLLGGGNLLDEYQEYEVKYIAETVREIA